MKRFNLEKIAAVLGIVCLLIGVFSRLEVIELRPEEPRRALVSLEMFLTGDWLIPHINAWPYFNKPPMHNWAMASAFHLFQSTDPWLVRLPSLLALLASAVLLFKWIRTEFSFWHSLTAALVYISCAEILLYGSVVAGDIDLFFSFIVLAQVLVFYWFAEKKSWFKAFLFSYLLCAMAFLTKGMPALAFQAITILAFLIYKREFRQLLGIAHILGIFSLSAIVGTYWFAFSQQEELLPYLVNLFKEASQRTGIESSFGSLLKGAAEFPLRLSLSLLPWTAMLLPLFNKSIRSGLIKSKLFKFALIFLLANIPLYWFTGELRMRYIYMFFPFFALFLALAYQDAIKQKLKSLAWVHGFWTLLKAVPILGLVGISLIPEAYQEMAIVPLIVLSVFGVLSELAIRKKLLSPFLSMFLWMVVLRFIFNGVYLPAAASDQLEQRNYRGHAENIHKIIGDETLHFTGVPYRFHRDLSLGPIKFRDDTLTTAPLLAYQLPYYLGNLNGKVVPFDTIQEAGKYYIARKSYLNYSQLKYDSLYGLYDDWQKVDLVVFQLSSSVDTLSSPGNSMKYAPEKEETTITK